MTALPSSLALAVVPDGSNIVASDHRNNYAAIQAAVNEIIAALGGGSAGQVLKALSSSSVDWSGGAYTGYVPTWASTGTQPTPGNATIAGSFTQIGKLVQGTIVLTMGSTTTFGTGTYIFSLPVACGYAANAPVGWALVNDASPANQYFQFAVIGGGGIVLQSPAAPAAVTTNTAPITFAQSDVIIINFCYQAS